MVLKSRLNKNEFKARLIKLTSAEKGFYFFTPYNSSGTPFCGKYDDDTFELTRNSFWKHIKAITIKGEYKESDNNTTEVSYTIGLSRFVRMFSILVPCIAFVFLNSTIIINRNSFNESFLSVLLTLNGFLIFGLVWAFMSEWFTKTSIDQRFKEAFGIGVEGGWQKLVARSDADELNHQNNSSMVKGSGAYRTKYKR
jgi:hypothetical protein